MTTRSKRDSGSEAADSAPTEPINAMKASLDCGDLKVRDSDRKFTDFLDLKARYHAAFLENLRLHVHGWSGDSYYSEELLHEEEVRRRCATEFLRKYGMFYWGTEENRRKHLAPERLKRPNELAIYPEREEEIARVIMILLQKKAKRDWKTSKTRTLAIGPLEAAAHSTHPARTPSPLHSESSIDYISGPKGYKTPDGTREVQTIWPDKSNEFSAQQLVGEEPRTPMGRTVNGIHNVKEDTSTAGSNLRTTNQLKRKRPPTELDFANKGTTFNGHRQSFVSRSALKADSLTSIEKKYQWETKFLVTSTASAQEDMAPVWVPYHRLESASDFLILMANECQDWEQNSGAQLSSDANLGDPTRRLSALGILAASVRFEWTGFEIRVRPGVDNDWKIVLEALKRAWTTKEVGDTSPEEFRIRVRLHVRY